MDDSSAVSGNVGKFRGGIDLRRLRLECRPDAGFMLEYKGHRGVFYVEQDRDRTFFRQVAQRKSTRTERFACVSSVAPDEALSLHSPS